MAGQAATDAEFLSIDAASLAKIDASLAREFSAYFLSGLRLTPVPGAGFAAFLVKKTYGIDFHTAVDCLAHVVYG